jgi:hypothetical protein
MYPPDSSCLGTSSLPCASCLLLISADHRLCFRGCDWASVRCGMAACIYLAVVLRVPILLSVSAPALLSVAGILQRDLWREWMHSGGWRGSGAGDVFVAGEGADLAAVESVVSIEGTGRTPSWRNLAVVMRRRCGSPMVWGRRSSKSIGERSGRHVGMTFIAFFAQCSNPHTQGYLSIVYMQLYRTISIF